MNLRKHFPAACRIILLALPFFWCGMLAAISFIEAPLKFQAPGITIPLGLGIGKLVFYALNRTEWVLLVVWVIAIFIPGRQKEFRYFLVAVLIILVLQSCWLLPALDVRAQEIRAGRQVSKSILHIIYAAAEGLKMLLLVASGIRMARLTKPGEN